LSEIKKLQVEGNNNAGVVYDDAAGVKSRDMFVNGVYESFMSKKQQL